MNAEHHSMIMEYLVHNCYKNTAKALINETTKLSTVSFGSTKKSIKDIDARYIKTEIFNHDPS